MEIGLALSGGGARGFAHVGVLQALLEEGFVPTRLSGASAGSIVCALYANGYLPKDIMDIFQKAKIRSVFSLSTQLTGFLKLGKIEKFLETYLPHNSFEQLNIPLTINATEIQTGEIVYFNSGPLIQPILASSCIPVLFEPLRVGNKLLVDGGILNNLPVEPLLNQCNFIVGVHSNPCGNTLPIINMRTVMERSLLLAIQNNIQDRILRCDYFIEPPELCRFTTLDASKAQELFSIGYKYTKEIAPQLKNLYEEKQKGREIEHLKQ
ncbi:patatin-like phospholipase family protein [Cytophagaceae bacterium DM2B3-1]|uniref:Patatin-like phospholipase family protein n=1 Tax=Xanthocytophaga flava TaxID=3048013 RepID=A0ABT7CCS7_9BACT|nr:patatin-like phospholipase family protein [Xanthocytophaga flavus]MDJ1470683.1 patatin-like phospholipase family protein [Xanthocytophaga flavus]MDJ1491474.1 patatin-like phospholipase family protein [Xanthocytophaga flavus]